MTPCRHERWEEVRLTLTDEHVANVCAVCLAELPLGYAGEVFAIHAWGRLEPIAYVPVSD